MNKKHYLLMGLMMLSTMVFSQENTWDQKESFVIKRERVGSFSIGSIGYLCAGLDSLVRNDLWQYDSGSDTWTQLSDLPGVARRNPVGFAVNGKGYVGTGHSGEFSSTGVPLDDFYEYDPALNSWVQIADYPGAGGNGVYFATAFATTTYGYVACGKKGTSNYENDLWRYDPVSDNWTQRANFPGGDRYNLMSFVVNDVAFVGFGSDQDIFRKDLWEYDEAINSWAQKADCEGVARASGGTFSLNGRGFICCGVDGGFKEDLWEYDPTMDRWKIRAYFPTDGRRYGVNFSLNNKGYFGCGKGSFGQKRSMYEYTPMTAFGWMQEEADLSELEKASFSVFPNPANEVINISWDEKIDVDHAILYQMNGMIAGNYSITSNELEIIRKGQSSGSYILTMVDSSGNIVGTHKIMLK